MGLKGKTKEKTKVSGTVCLRECFAFEKFRLILFCRCRRVGKLASLLLTCSRYRSVVVSPGTSSRSRYCSLHYRYSGRNLVKRNPSKQLSISFTKEKTKTIMDPKSLATKLSDIGSRVGTKVLDLFVKKALAVGGSWGGKECAAYLPMKTHLFESSIICWKCIFIFGVFRLSNRFNDHYMITKINMLSLKYRSNPTERMIDKILAVIHIGMYFQLIYYKFNCSSLISLIQPCHVILLLEGISLASDGPLGVVISTLILPSLSGSFLGILFPDTTGLDQPLEEISYWIQHYLIVIIPVYLLVRRNGLAMDLSSFFTLAFGLWILTFLHFFFYEVRCGVVWCGVVWCGVVWCGVVWCGVVWCGVVWCCVVLCCVVLCCCAAAVLLLCCCAAVLLLCCCCAVLQCDMVCWCAALHCTCVVRSMRDLHACYHLCQLSHPLHLSPLSLHPTPPTTVTSTHPTYHCYLHSPHLPLLPPLTPPTTVTTTHSRSTSSSTSTWSSCCAPPEP